MAVVSSLDPGLATFDPNANLWNQISGALPGKVGLLAFQASVSSFRVLIGAPSTGSML